MICIYYFPLLSKKIVFNWQSVEMFLSFRHMQYSILVPQFRYLLSLSPPEMVVTRRVNLFYMMQVHSY
jgi:hypothetical protein